MKMKKKLEPHKGKRIIVVMTDSYCFRGDLLECEEDYVTLGNVEETANENVEWMQDAPTDKKKKGYHLWKKVNFPEAILRLDHVTRIWPCPLEKTKSKERKEQAIYIIEDNIRPMIV